MKKLFLLMVLTLFLVGCSGDFSGNFELSYNESEDEDVPEETVPEEPVPEDRTLGDENAPVVFVEYSSFTSPFSASFNQDTLGDILDHFVESGDVLYVYKHFHMNDLDVEAANAAECAGDQGQFFEYKDAIYDSQDSIGQPGFFEGIAESLGLDMNSWQSCVDEVRYDQKISEDRNEAIQAGIQGTPEFLVNGENSISGSQSFDAFRDVINEELGVPEEPVPEENLSTVKVGVLAEGDVKNFGGSEIVFRGVESDSVVLEIDGQTFTFEDDLDIYVNRGDLFVHVVDIHGVPRNNYLLTLSEGESENVLGFDVELLRFGLNDVARVMVDDGNLSDVHVISVGDTVDFSQPSWFGITLDGIVSRENLLDPFNYLEGFDFEYNNHAFLEVETYELERKISLEQGFKTEVFGAEIEFVRDGNSSVFISVNGEEREVVYQGDYTSFLDPDLDIYLDNYFFGAGSSDFNVVDLTIVYNAGAWSGNKNYAILILAEGDVSDLSVDSRDSSLPESCSVGPGHFDCSFFSAWRAVDFDGEESGAFNLVLTNQVNLTLEEVDVKEVRVSGQEVDANCSLIDRGSLPISFGDNISLFCEDMDSSFWAFGGEKESFQVVLDYRAQGQQLARTITVDLFATVQ